MSEIGDKIYDLNQFQDEVDESAIGYLEMSPDVYKKWANSFYPITKEGRHEIGVRALCDTDGLWIVKIFSQRQNYGPVKVKKFRGGVSVKC